MTFVTGVLLGGSETMIFDYDDIQVLTFDYRHEIFTVELSDCRCFNCYIYSFEILEDCDLVK